MRRVMPLKRDWATDTFSAVYIHDAGKFFGHDTEVEIRSDGIYSNLDEEAIRPAIRRYISQGVAEQLINTAMLQFERLRQYALGQREPLVDEILAELYIFYFSQAVIRTFFATVALDELRLLGISAIPHMDRNPVMHSTVPADVAITHIGFPAYDNNKAPIVPKGVTEDFLKELQGKSWDYAFYAIRLGQIVAMASFFSESENPYTFSVLRRVRHLYSKPRWWKKGMEWLIDILPFPTMMDGKLMFVRDKRDIRILL